MKVFVKGQKTFLVAEKIIQYPCDYKYDLTVR